ncbi:MAG: His-Xaa-Ser system radical SAM maturase HxsC [Bacilli bacterium]
MIIKLDNYIGQTKIVSFAKTDTTIQNLFKENLETVYVKDGKLKFLLSGEERTLSDKNIILFNQCHDYDVFEIDEVGNAFLYYSNERVDNALMLSSKCNSNCIMCPVSDGIRKKNNTPANIILDIIKHMPKYPSHITITGGEPFIIGTDIFTIFKALKNKFRSTEFLLLTNGRALAYKPYFEKFRETIPNNTIIGIPIHGHNEELHDNITRSTGGFKQTIIGIKHLLAYDYKVELRMVVSNFNKEHIGDIAELIVTEFHNVYSVKIMGLEMLGNAAKNQNDVWVSYNEAFAYSKNAIVKLIENGIDVALYNFPLCSVEENFHLICKKSITDYKINFFDECNQCSLKNSCGGVFDGSKRLAKYDIKPWR